MLNGDISNYVDEVIGFRSVPFLLRRRSHFKNNYCILDVIVLIYWWGKFYTEVNKNGIEEHRGQGNGVCV